MLGQLVQHIPELVVRQRGRHRGTVAGDGVINTSLAGEYITLRGQSLATLRMIDRVVGKPKLKLLLGSTVVLHRIQGGGDAIATIGHETPLGVFRDILVDFP
jgi:hypothetical protein